MRWLDRVGRYAETLAELTRLQISGRTAAALRAAERALTSVSDPYVRAEIHIRRLSALVNLGRTAHYPAAVEEAFAAAGEVTDPYFHGHLHAITVLATRQLGSLERGATHLVYASRALNAAEGQHEYLAWGWHNLAMAYSYLGFHSHAMATLTRAQEVGAAAGVPATHLAQPGVRLRMALAMDHHGDTDGCVRVLRDLTAELTCYDDLRKLRPSGQAGYGYALARLAALGHPPSRDPRPLLAAGVEGQRARDMRLLGDVCLSVAAGKATDALTRLETVTVSPDTFGPAELSRLRCLAFLAAGDHVAAHHADRRAFRLAAQRTDRLRDGFLDGIAARIDQEDLRRAVAHHSGEQLTDALTGLPNRAHLERYVSARVGRGERVLVGTVDVQGLETARDTHGRLAGDLVLQRLAGVLVRVMRRGDFVARSSNDRFVVVLPYSSARHATEVSRRISEAVTAEDWASLVPGSAIGVAVTWKS